MVLSCHAVHTDTRHILYLYFERYWLSPAAPASETCDSLLAKSGGNPGIMTGLGFAATIAGLVPEVPAPAKGVEAALRFAPTIAELVPEVPAPAEGAACETGPADQRDQTHTGRRNQ